eukprot:CAMPEP_0196222264 /NCGR_PEP_ID=MMETSP0912-20130531/44391_1 /TAXON_ID=49265 /ORGANISM="Thalassiosira rotula, Strain GSO102" /LENGTH=72 /DNA_ID=CAMNT_0041501003 /DNA_START=55 /DNA_END=270 /DNA_ORIENTATION=-
MGADIAGACGQLVVEQEKNQLPVTDIEDGPFRQDGPEKRQVTVFSKRRQNEADPCADSPKNEINNLWIGRLK